MKNLVLTSLLACSLFSACTSDQKAQQPKLPTDLPTLISSLNEHDPYTVYKSKYSTHLCKCISEDSSKGNLTQLTSNYQTCAKSYLKNNPSSTNPILNYLKKNHSFDPSNDNIAFKLEQILAGQGNHLMANNCAFFVEEFKILKSRFISDLQVNSSNIDSKISQFRNEIRNATEPDQAVNLYTILGVLNEHNGATDNARKYYEAGAKVNASNSNICLIMLELLD